MKKPVIAFLVLFFASTSSFARQPAIKINSNTFDQADTVILKRVDRSTAQFSVVFLDRKHKSILIGGTQTVILGLHYQLKKGTYSVVANWSVDSGTRTAKFAIFVREIFPKLPYDPPKRNPEEQEKIRKEADEKRETLGKLKWHPNSLPNFTMPLKQIKINANFGEKRCRDRRGQQKFNCRYHLGTDYRSAFDLFRQKPEPTYAINDGMVVMVSERYMDGRIIVIDHGNGLSSEYLHLSKQLVRRGDTVKRGQMIAITGKTGATEAIHLHLTIKMDYGKTVIDPQRFLNMMIP